MNYRLRSVTRHVVPLALVVRLVTLTTPDSLAVAATLPSSLPQPAQVVQAQTETPSFSPLLSVEQFLAETNAARRQAGLPALTLNQTLNRAAGTKVADMAARGYWDHFRPGDNKAPWDFIKEAGYEYTAAGENLARGFKTAAGITDAWMASPSHRANILSEHYTEVGFAVIESFDESGESVLLTVQFFGGR